MSHLSLVNRNGISNQHQHLPRWGTSSYLRHWRHAAVELSGPLASPSQQPRLGPLAALANTMSSCSAAVSGRICAESTLAPSHHSVTPTLTYMAMAPSSSRSPEPEHGVHFAPKLGDIGKRVYGHRWTISQIPYGVRSSMIAQRWQRPCSTAAPAGNIPFSRTMISTATPCLTLRT